MPVDYIRKANKEMELLKLNKIRKTFGGLQALGNVSLSVQKGSIVSLIGPNGSGKTTLFNIITGVYRPTAGEVIFEGEDITNIKTYQIIRRGISRVFQDTSLFSRDTVLQNVIAASYAFAGIKSLEDFFNTPAVQRKRQAREERALEILRSLNMISLKDSLARELSYGSQRLLSIAIAKSVRPKFMLLDEPLTGMNPSEKAETIALIKEIREKDKITILLVEHDMRSVMNLSDKIVVFNFGEKIAEGTPEEVKNDNKVIDCYLGEDWLKEVSEDDT